MARVPRKPLCHPDRKHYAQGQCEPCYRRRRALAGKRPPRKKRATCHPDRPHYGHGLCRPCWRTAAKRGTLPSSRPARCHPKRPDWGGGKCRNCISLETKQRRRDRKFVAAIRRQTGADASGLDPEGYGLCWRCRARRSKRPGVPRLICAHCERRILAKEERGPGRKLKHIHPSTPLAEILSWLPGLKGLR